MAPHDRKLLLLRRLLLLALLITIVLLGVGGWLASRPDPIQPGMSRAEVEAILGPPDGRMLAIESKELEDLVLVWKNRRIAIEFDKDNHVRKVMLPPSMIDKVRGLFGF